jgi:hypothetical protein
MEYLCCSTSRFNFFYIFLFEKLILILKILNKSKEIFLKILDNETTNNMPLDIIDKAKKIFDERLQSINWNEYCNDIPFNQSALSLYEWAPNS